MKYRGFGLLECSVLCENRALADLGVGSEVWLPFTLDLNTVQAIKLAVDDEHTDSVQHGCAQVFFRGVPECIVIDIPYRDLKLVWLAFKAGELQADKNFITKSVTFTRNLCARGEPIPTGER